MSLSTTPGKKLTKYIPDYCVFDLETTGVSYKTDAVIEISAVKVKGGEVADEFTTLVNPGRPIPYMATEVNNITNAMVADAPDFETALSDFLNFAGDLVLVGHNIHSFDMKFIYRDAEQYWGKTIGNDYIDTLTMARMVLPQLNHFRLVDLAEHYGINADGAHRALADCRMNQEIFELLGKDAQSAAVAAGPIPTCPKCGSFLMRRNGKFGEFWGCTGYPNCRFTKNV